MKKIYSTNEAKAKFSEILRYVREGETVTVSYHGEPVAEIRPLDASTGLGGRLRRLEDRGILVRSGDSTPRFEKVKRGPGALDRLLQDRGE